MDDVVIRPLTESDIVAFYGRTLPQTCHGWAVDYKGGLACIAGVLFNRPLMIVFSEIKPGLHAPAKTVWRTALKLWDNIKGLGHPELYAIAAPVHPGAPAFLERLGFTPFENDARGEVFRWAIR